MHKNWKFYLRLGIWATMAALWLLVLGKHFWNSSASAVKKSTIPVINMTQSVQVVRAGPVRDNQFTITIRNVSNQTIEDLAYSFDPRQGLNSHNYAIPPGAMYDERIGINPAMLDANPNPQLTILAVSFEDGSGEGVSPVVETLIDQDLGMRMGILAVSPVFESLCEQPYERLAGAIPQAKEEIQRIPAPPEGRSVHVRAAFQSIIQEGIRKADQLIEIYGVSSQDVMNSRLANTKDQYSLMLSSAKVWMDRFNSRVAHSAR